MSAPRKPVAGPPHGGPATGRLPGHPGPSGDLPGPEAPPDPAVPPGQDGQDGDDGPQHPPRVVVRADLRPALLAALTVALLGPALGWLWSRLAPAELVTVLADPGRGQDGVLPLVGQSEHRFDGMAVFVMIGLVAGTLTGAAAWQLRRRRGPVLLVGVVLGSLAAAALAALVGPWLAELRYPDAQDAAAGQIVALPPVLESAWVVVSQPFAAAIAYSLAVAWNGTDDLGRP